MNTDIGNELSRLASKVEQVVALCEALRTENRRLNDRVGELEKDRDAFAKRMTEARMHLEKLMERLP